MSYAFTGNSADFLAPASNAVYGQAPVTAMSLAFWFKRTSTGRSDLVYGRTDASMYFFVNASDKLDAEGGVSKVGTASIGTGAWHHYCWTSDASGNWVWYIDGVSDATGSGWTWGGTTQTVHVGAVSSVSCSGKIAYLTLWSTQLSGGNVTTLQTATTPESVGSGCVAAWHLSTSALTDSSGTANDLVLTNGGGSISFDADNPSIGGGGSRPMFRGS